MAAQKHHTSTQKFTEIKDIVENVVLLDGNYATMVVEVQAINFTLLSEEEQKAKIYAYASLLNSLAFSVQILVRNKKVDISAYIKLLDAQVQRMESTGSSQNEVENQQNEKILNYVKLYRDFCQELIKINTVLDKRFYIVLTYSSLEKGVEGVVNKGDFASQAKAALTTKAETVLTQLSRLSLRAKILEKEELVKLYYDIYNQDSNEGFEIDDIVGATVVKGQQA